MKSGFVAVAGRPNVGKSTLVNALCGEKIAIASDKPQTTRRRVSGVANGDGFQLVLADLPGFQRPRDALTERMQRTVDSSFEDVDGALFVLAADEAIGSGDRFIAERVFGGDAPVVVALNKIDRIPPPKVLEQIVRAAELGPFQELHPVSARTGEGVDALRESLVALLPEGPAYFPPGEVTDLSLTERVGELVREQALEATREEVPHSVGVEVEELEEARVRAVVYVETESQKGILVGKGGSMIRTIGSRARPEIERLLGGRCSSSSSLKVRPRWRRDENLLERLGI